MTNTDPNRPPQHGTSKITEVKKGRNWLPWILAALALLALLFLLTRCGRHDKAVTTNSTVETTTTTTGSAAPASTATPPVGVEKVTLPGGKTVDLEPKTLNYELQQFLASSEPTPRKFTFDRLNFATDSAELPADAQATTSALAQILSAYPKARVELQGYADASGSNPHNVRLGAERAKAVQQALVAQGVGVDRISLASGGSSNPADTNATAQGRAENRRTELLVTAK